MEAAFVEIVRKLTPTSEFLKAVRIASNGVFEKVKGTPNASVARVLIGGSIGKQTAINETLFELDVDLIVFVNKPQGQKEEDILKIFLGELNKIPGFDPKPSNPISGNLLQFTLPVTVGGKTVRVEFDLVVATNNGENQVVSALEEIGENLSIETIHRYGPGLSREAVALAKELSKGRTRDVVRVCKFWDKTLKKYDQKWRFISGRSYMIELIAIAANKDALDDSVYQGFLRFLKKMTDFENMYVVFTEGYNYDQIPAEIRNQRPVVMDPINYYYNVAQGVDSESVKKYQDYAAKTIQAIQGYLPHLVNQNFPLTVDNFHKLMGFF